MTSAIRLIGGPDHGREIDLPRADALDWPERVYVSDAVICTADLQFWDPDVVRKLFHPYHRTELVGEGGRRVYRWDPGIVGGLSNGA